MEKSAQSNLNLSKTVVILDDDFVIRFILKKYVKKIGDNLKINIKVYTSSNGIEGLGLIYVTNPDLILIDSTLPKYSGVELTSYLTSNKSIENEQTPVIILGESEQMINSEKNEFSENFAYFNKAQPNSLLNILGLVERLLSQVASLDSIIFDLQKDKSFFDRFESRLNIKINKLINYSAQEAISWANKSDVYLNRSNNTNYFFKAFLFLSWFASQIFISIHLTILYVFIGKDTDENIKQRNFDSSILRVKYYPSLLTLFGSFLFILFQIFLFMAGGVTILHIIRLESAFAAISNQTDVDFSAAEFDDQSIALENNVLVLKQKRAEVIFTKPINYSSLTSIREESTVNTFESSGELDSFEEVVLNEMISDPLSSPISSPIDNLRVIENNSVNIQEKIDIDDLNVRVIPTSGITYQLSPDKINWYYFSGNGKWEATYAGWTTSNTIQEVNQFISSFDTDTQNDSRSVYIKAYIQNEKYDSFELRRLVVERDLNPISIISGDENLDNVESYVTFHASDTQGNSLTQKEYNFQEPLSQVEFSNRLMINTFTHLDKIFDEVSMQVTINTDGNTIEKIIDENTIIDRINDIGKAEYILNKNIAVYMNYEKKGQNIKQYIVIENNGEEKVNMDIALKMDIDENVNNFIWAGQSFEITPEPLIIRAKETILPTGGSIHTATSILFPSKEYLPEIFEYKGEEDIGKLDIQGYYDFFDVASLDHEVVIKKEINASEDISDDNNTLTLFIRNININANSKYVIDPLIAADPEWNQSDWIGGPGQLNLVDTTQYYSGENIDDSVSGEIGVETTLP